MMAETDARRLRRKNAKALQVAIEHSEREAKEAAEEKARVTKLKRELDREVRRMKGLIVLSDSDSDSDNGDCDSCTPPPQTTKSLHQLWTPTAASATGRAKARRGSGEAPPSSSLISSS